VYVLKVQYIGCESKREGEEEEVRRGQYYLPWVEVSREMRSHVNRILHRPSPILNHPLPLYMPFPFQTRVSNIYDACVQEPRE
jgi:hypothetical protein